MADNTRDHYVIKLAITFGTAVIRFIGYCLLSNRSKVLRLFLYNFTTIEFFDRSLKKKKYLTNLPCFGFD